LPQLPLSAFDAAKRSNRHLWLSIGGALPARLYRSVVKKSRRSSCSTLLRGLAYRIRLTAITFSRHARRGLGEGGG
jgi:hypothetical protein